jgi:hypothetical protein
MGGWIHSSMYLPLQILTLKIYEKIKDNMNRGRNGHLKLKKPWMSVILSPCIKLLHKRL